MFSAAARSAQSAVSLRRWRRQAKAHALGIGQLLLIPEESLLITSGYDHTVRLWDSASGASVMRIENEHKCRFTVIRWNAPAEELLLADELGHLSFYSLTTERCTKKEKVRHDGTGAEKHAAAIRDLSVANGEVLVTGATSADAWLVVRDVQYSEAKGHEAAVIAVAVTDGGGPGAARAGGGGGGGGDDATVVYSASLDNTVRAWDPYDMATLSVLREVSSEISCLLVSPHCDFVITGNDDGSIRLWNPDSGSTVTLEGHTNTVTCLDVASRGGQDFLLSSGYDAHVGIWDISKKKNELPRLEVLFRAHSLEVLCLKANLHNGTFITSGNDKHIHVWSLASFAQVARLEGHAEAVTCLALDGNFLLSGSEDGVVHVWDLHSYMALASLQVHEAPIEGMLIVPENGLLVTCSTDCTVRVWDYGMGREITVWRHPDQFRCVAMRKSTGHVLAGTEQHSIVAFPFSEVLAARERLEQQDRDLEEQRELEQSGRHESAPHEAPHDAHALVGAPSAHEPLASP